MQTIKHVQTPTIVKQSNFMAFEISQKKRDESLAFWKDIVYRRSISWRQALLDDEYTTTESTEARRTKTMLIRDIDVAEACIAELLFMNAAAGADLKESEVATIMTQSTAIKDDLELAKFWNRSALRLAPRQKCKSIWRE